MIKELAKKNLFLKQIVRKYRHTRKQPLWKPLLQKNYKLWSSALNAAQNGQKILIATSVGSHLAGTVLESTLAIALTLRGTNVHVLLCDAVLPACLACWSDIYPDHKQFSEKGPSNDCKDCFEPAFKMYRSIGLNVHKYSDFISSADIKKAIAISSSLPYQDIKNYKLGGLAIGEHAMAGTLRFFACGTLDDEPYGEQILRRYLNASLLTLSAITNLLRSHSFTSVILHHGIYVPQGIIGEVCRQKCVHVITWNPAYRKKCFIFSHYDTYHHTMISEPTEKWANILWNNQTETKLMDYLKSRWKGTQDWIWFHYKPEFELQNIIDKTGVDFSKPCIGLLTSVMWDAVLHYPSNAFPNMLEWVLRTIEYFLRRPDLQLIIRIHPAEIRGTLPARQKIADEIAKFFPQLPQNIIVIPPESNISTYALMSKCNSVIIYNTKMGIELTAMGIPVIVAGEAWIRNKGFAIDVNNPEDYFKVLDQLPFSQRMSEENTLKAKKYAYHFFFRRMIPLDFMEPSKGVPQYRINIKNINEMTQGKCKGLDVICEGILKGNDFIFFIE